MAVRIQLGSVDLGRVRFAISPAYETVMAVSALRVPGEHPMHVPWASWARLRTAGIPDLKLLEALTAYHAKPASLMPPPDARMPDMAAELRRVRAASPRHIRADIEFLARNEARMPRILREIHADPDAFLPRIVDALRCCHDLLIEPQWERITRVLEADITYRSSILTEHGTEAVLAGLHREVAWREGELIVHGTRTPGTPQAVTLTGQALVLCPSAFSWPRVTVSVRPIGAGTLRYPARGIATMWEPSAAPDGGIAVLLGRTRAAILAVLGQPVTTGDVARRLDVTAGAVSQHLNVLREAGLVASRRDGRTLLHLRTERGDALLR